MADVFIAIDLFCLIVALILLVGSCPVADKVTESTSLYQWNLVVLIFGLVSDIFAYGMAGMPHPNWVIVVINVLPYLCVAVMLGVFTAYLLSVLREQTLLTYRALFPVLAVVTLDIVVVIVGASSGYFFTVVDQRVVLGDWKDLPSVLSGICLVYDCGLMIRYRKVLGGRKLLGIGSYMFFPLLVVVLQLFTELDFAYAAITLSYLCTYVAVQSQAISEAALREQISSEMAQLDSLTGLNNRRVYDRILERVPRGIPVCAIFCDLNNLKHTNDHLGHAAGDQLITRFSEMLKEGFMDGNLCRISGDEFVVILSDISEEETDRRVKEFQEKIRANDRIAALGYVYGINNGLVDMVRQAEENMYKDKSAYYKETGKDRRR